MEDCIFCKIARGDVPVPFVYEDSLVVAFRDAEPQAPAHVLVVPRTHYTGLNDEVPADVAAALCLALPKVAAAVGVAESGYRVIVNTGSDARQSVPHLHLHLLGGAPMTHGMVNL
jgi:histidine triad (HIT) family protein